MISLSELYEDLQPLDGAQTASQATEVMKSAGFNCLPMAEQGGRYAGMVRHAKALRAKPMTPCASIVEEAEPLHADLAPIEALSLFSQTDDDLVACIDRAKNFVGAVSRKDIVRLTAALTATGPDGASICVSMKEREYSLARIASIVEQCGASVLSATTDRSVGDIQLLLKISSPEATAVCEALERHGIEAYAYGEAETADDNLLRRNYNELMMYLNV